MHNSSLLLLPRISSSYPLSLDGLVPQPMLMSSNTLEPGFLPRYPLCAEGIFPFLSSFMATETLEFHKQRKGGAMHHAQVHTCSVVDPRWQTQMGGRSHLTERAKWQHQPASRSQDNFTILYFFWLRMNGWRAEAHPSPKSVVLDWHVILYTVLSRLQFEHRSCSQSNSSSPKIAS